MSALVNLTTMSERHDDDKEHIIVDCVDDAVLTDTHAQTGPTRKRPGTGRSRIPGQQGNRALHARSSCGFELP